MLPKNIGVLFPFLLVSLSGYGIQLLQDSYNEFEHVPSSSIFWKTLRRIDNHSPLDIGRIHKQSHLSWAFLWEDFRLLNPSLYFLLDCSDFFMIQSAPARLEKLACHFALAYPYGSNHGPE